MDLAPIIERHTKPVLQFSGGKDSLACLYLLEPFWGRLTVAWCNTGDAFPETVELMAKVRELVPHFLEVKSDQPAQIEKWGYPTDVLPVRSHASIMFLVHPHARQKLQGCFACCADNLWEPMQREMQRIGATLIIRGQRLAEVQRSPVRSGDVIGGVEFLFPIEDWTGGQVREYVASKPLGLPENYRYMDTGLDCMHCTGHLFENIGKRRYMAERHPEAYNEVSRRLDVIASAVSRELDDIKGARSAGTGEKVWS